MRSKSKANVFLGFILKYITYCSSILFMRLFVIMGISWIMEGISFFISTDDKNCYFLIFDIWNTIQGVPLFILFIMKRRTWNLINSRFVHYESTNSIVLNNHIEFFPLKLDIRSYLTGRRPVVHRKHLVKARVLEKRTYNSDFFIINTLVIIFHG